MSLTRVSSIDGFEREPESGSLRPRRMSFSPIPQLDRESMDRKQSIVTELVFVEVPKKKRMGKFLRPARLDISNLV